MVRLELGMTSSTWDGSHVGLEQGIRHAKDIGFDTYDIFSDPLDIDDDIRRRIRDLCANVDLPIRSCICVAFGIVDFNPSVAHFTLDRVKAYIDQAVYFEARNVLLVIGEYYWYGEIIPRESIWEMAVRRCKELSEYAASRGIEIVLQLEPFPEALVRDVDALMRFVSQVDRANFLANADISHLHLSEASIEDIAKLTGRIGHVHLSDCDGKVHGDFPAGMGVTPIRDYLQAIVDSGYEGTISVDLGRSPNPDVIGDWVTQAYESAAQIMREVGVRP